MTSIISSMIQALFPTLEYRALMIGLDASGRTTALYKLKLGEVVTTIPTIGFNVEAIEYRGTHLTLWDVGGCDKIRPLWRHYYQNTQALFYFVDSNDRQRLEDTVDFFHQTMREDELRNTIVVIIANKQDLPNAMSVQEVATAFKLHEMKRGGRICTVVGTCATSGDGLYEALDWIVDSLKGRRDGGIVDGGSPPGGGDGGSGEGGKERDEAALSPAEQEAKRMEALLMEWLEREDDEDDVFLQKLEDATLDVWDHRTHLRIAWLLLKLHGRREGMQRIFASIKSFIERSPRTKRSDTSRGTTFHETMTYFWVHMVDYAMQSARGPREEFKTFLLMSPQLVNGGLFLHYYSKQRMLLNAEARSSVLLPDLRPLPSLLGGVEGKSASPTPVHVRLQPRAPLSDEEFLEAFQGSSEGGAGATKGEGEAQVRGVVTGWGHDVKMRLIYLLLFQQGRRGGGTQVVLDAIQAVEKSGFHLTLNYFWIQMMSYQIALLQRERRQGNAKPMSVFTTSTGEGKGEGEGDGAAAPMAFDDFYRRPVVQPLRNQLLYEKYYSRRLIDAEASATEFALPDLKPLPSVV